ncbi:hypothetical protein ACFWFQ_29370 [Nocardia salmonicida]|uniref:hypothetical protein n=1 Tax=Nocardia salmonicida TaxID=53431 RepID=UPI00365F9B0E
MSEFRRANQDFVRMTGLGLGMRLTKSAARAAANSYMASRAANAAQYANEAALLEEGRIDQLQAEQLREQQDLNEAQQQHNREMLEIQQRNAWMMYRQTPDGQAFQEWCARTAPILDLFDRMNDEWLAAFNEVARQSIPAAEWTAEATYKTTSTVEGYVGYRAFLPPDHKMLSPWRSSSMTDTEKMRILEEVRQHMHQQRINYFGCDPVNDPDTLPPGWAVDDANWLIPVTIRAYIQHAYTNYPAPSEFPDLPEWPPFLPSSEVKPPHLVSVINQWRQPGGVSDRATSIE